MLVGLRTQDLIKAVLKLSRAREFYGYEVHRSLTSVADVEISRFYRVLAKMLKEGYLESRWERSPLGPRKRMYRLGTKGRSELHRILLDAIATVHGSYEDYLLCLPPKFNPLDSVWSFLAGELRSKAAIAYVTVTYPLIIERVIRRIHGKVREGKIYLVSSSPAAVKPNMDGVFLLNGTYDNIPLKEAYVDLLVVRDVPRRNLLKTALREWDRVLAPKGLLAILTPTFLTRKYEDPLTIGEFVDKHEHERAARVDKRYLTALLNSFFQKVEERQCVHLTVFSASKRISQRHP